MSEDREHYTTPCSEGTLGCCQPERHKKTECWTYQQEDELAGVSPGFFADHKLLPPAEHAAVEVQLLMTEPAVALEVMRQLFAALPDDQQDAMLRELDSVRNPWGEPGFVPNVPMDGGQLWVGLPLGGVRPATVIDCATNHRPYTIADDETNDEIDEPLITVACFRKRWAPEPP